MRINFATGLIIGVLFASVFVLASGGFQSPSLLGLSPATGGIVQYTAATTTTAISSTTQSTAATNAAAPSNLTGSGTVNGASQLDLSSPLSSISGQAPSSLAAIVSRPSQSLLFLLPIALAIVLGFAFYKKSASDE